MPEDQYYQKLENLPPVGSAYPPVIEINHRQKAAIVVNLLRQNGADMPLSQLPGDLKTDLTHQITQLRLVDQKTLKAVTVEFTHKLNSIGLSASGGV